MHSYVLLMQTFSSLLPAVTTFCHKVATETLKHSSHVSCLLFFFHFQLFHSWSDWDSAAVKWLTSPHIRRFCTFTLHTHTHTHTYTHILSLSHSHTHTRDFNQAAATFFFFLFFFKKDCHGCDWACTEILSEMLWERELKEKTDLFPEGNNTMSNLTRLISCLLVFVSQSHSLHVSERDGQRFLEDILHYYGQNNSISTEDLDHFLLLISARRSEEITEGNPLENQEVFYIYQVFSYCFNSLMSI